MQLSNMTMRLTAKTSLRASACSGLHRTYIRYMTNVWHRGAISRVLPEGDDKDASADGPKLLTLSLIVIGNFIKAGYRKAWGVRCCPKRWLRMAVLHNIPKFPQQSVQGIFLLAQRYSQALGMWTVNRKMIFYSCCK